VAKPPPRPKPPRSETNGLLYNSLPWPLVFWEGASLDPPAVVVVTAAASELPPPQPGVHPVDPRGASDAVAQPKLVRCRLEGGVLHGPRPPWPAATSVPAVVSATTCCTAGTCTPTGAITYITRCYLQKMCNRLRLVYHHLIASETRLVWHQVGMRHTANSSPVDWR
jgi:hypothetical protein